MPDNKKELLVLYYDKKTNGYYEVLLNDLELGKISTEIVKIFDAKRSGVMVSDTKLNIEQEVK